MIRYIYSENIHLYCSTATRGWNDFKNREKKTKKKSKKQKNMVADPKRSKYKLTFHYGFY